MSRRAGRFLGSLLALGFLFPCSSTPAELVAKHTKRGDEYAQKEKYLGGGDRIQERREGGPGGRRAPVQAREG